MAITAPHARLFRSLPLLRGGALLEIGEANWYEEHDAVKSFAMAKAFYAETFEPDRIVSIDAGGTPAALRCDLNKELTCFNRQPADVDDPAETFDVVINHGTAEHIFNIAQVFRTIHDACAIGGLMIHDAPFTGWLDHGFYTLQPTLFYDLAAANCYEVVGVWITEITANLTLRVECREAIPQLAAAGKIPNNSMLFVCLRKMIDQPFRIPQQGYYAGALSAAGNQAWRAMR